MADKINAERRERFGKGAARKLRAAGRIPAVIYGHGTDPVHISLPGHETALIIRKANAVLDLDLGSGSQLVLVKDVQKDPVRQIIEHVDLLVVRSGETVQVEVPVHLEGESAPGTIATLDAQTLLLDVEATHIPERIVLPIEGLADGTHVTAADVQLPEGAKLASDPELLVVGISTPAAEPEPEEAPAAADADAESTPAA
ncbi:50S ribosomal protein L25/general stress protein Ctc [Amnibacterium sp. CER49]|uniref:50S ribosomal protein L25/general stress protein Ctc n=1 Tax=Amnibacterium sp. CER49 TaxID=3039161 RepID=UPI002446F3D9|nr:50S ribosomal protein L25/general stress protein Ctc [Amnibacterium sp. CER49]MDH2445445.1 50S ribosomal protein L25/general stress protein Ctc [Amnibacterium sp. CER49]